MTDFAAFWEEVDRELARIPAAPELEQLPLRSTDFATVYAVRSNSLGSYRTFAYLSLPNAGGPFPSLIETPRYGSVNHVPAYELRQRYVVFTIMHRGQRLADVPFAAAYPGLLTLGIDDAAQYVYRGIVADCLRGTEFLLGYPGIDTDRVGIIGDDLALITAARRPRIAAVQLTGLMFYRLLEASGRTAEYPLEEVNDTLRTYPEQREAISRTLALFDPLHHARDVTAQTLIAADGAGWLQPLLDALGSRAEVYQLSHEGRTDHDALDRWLAERLLLQRAA
jgi:cephalosporin-C deacetylase